VVTTSTSNDAKVRPLEADCPAGADCGCEPNTQAIRHLSWTMTLALTAFGASLCFLLVKLLGA
jgi:hypothetical protein